VKEQSHKDEMASALRGDFARLRSRGVATTLAPPDDVVPPVAAPEAPCQEPEPDAVPAEQEPPAPERPWIARFLGSR
jgi:hypothetical protein